MFSKKTKNSDIANLITLSDVKRQLNIIDFNDDDSLLESLVPVAVSLVETGSRKLLGDYTVEVTCKAENLPSYLPFFPWGDTIDAITVDDIDAIDTHSFNNVSGELNVVQRHGLVNFTYNCGYKNRDEVPKVLKQAILIIVANLYANREDVTTMSIETVPFTSKVLIDSSAWRGI